MRTENIRVRLRDGVMGAHVAYPERTPAGAIIAIMEIWGVNDTMRRHAQEFAEAGYICLVPDLFWRQEPGVELSDRQPGDGVVGGGDDQVTLRIHDRRGDFGGQVCGQVGDLRLREGERVAPCGGVGCGVRGRGARVGQPGVVPGGDMTTEAALTKLMHLLAVHSDPAAVRSGLLADLRGERTPD